MIYFRMTGFFAGVLSVDMGVCSLVIDFDVFDWAEGGSQQNTAWIAFPQTATLSVAEA